MEKKPKYSTTNIFVRVYSIMTTSSSSLMYLRVIGVVLDMMGDGPLGFDANTLSAATRLIEDLKFSSLDMIELLIGMEEEFGCVLDLSGVQTLRDLLVVAIGTDSSRTA